MNEPADRLLSELNLLNRNIVEQSKLVAENNARLKKLAQIQAAFVQIMLSVKKREGNAGMVSLLLRAVKDFAIRSA